MNSAKDKSRLEEAWRLQRSGDLVRAKELCAQIVRSDRRNSDAHLMLGFLCGQLGQFAEAERSLGEAIKLNPGTDAYFLRGYALQKMNRHEEALNNFKRALAINPNLPKAALAQGVSFSILGRHREALAAYDQAVRLETENPSAWYYRASAQLELSQSREALESCEKALKAKRDYPEAWRLRGVALLQLDEPEAALASLDQALALAPDFAEALIDRAALLMRFQRYAEALACQDRALVLRPSDADLLYNRANTLTILGRYDQAIPDCKKVLAIRPDYPYARGVLINCKLQCCDWRGFQTEKEKIAEGVSMRRRVVSPFNYKALFDSPERQLECTHLMIAHEHPPSPDPLWRGERCRHERIRVAYVSADLHHTVVASLAAGLFEAHDRSRFEVIGVSFGEDDGTPMRKRLERGFERFVDVRGHSDADIAALLRRSEIDIAVDLMGLTGECRPGIFAKRHSPIQVNYLGFAGSMGAPYIDYIVADRVVIPEDERIHYDEQVVYLPHSYLPHDRKRAVSERTPDRREAGLPEQGFVFCSFNNTYKFTPEIFDVWMRLLRTLDGSVLWLPRSNEAAMRNLHSEAQQRGVASERVIFAPQVPRPEDHLARLRAADLFLDTLPYNAHATASDALWSGLPLLTCAGASFASRVAASLLHAAGLPELVVCSLEAYEAKALDLARDPERLRALRDKLARQRQSAPLFDTAAYTRDLESAYSNMWERWQRGDPPLSFSVGAPP